MPFSRLDPSGSSGRRQDRVDRPRSSLRSVGDDKAPDREADSVRAVVERVAHLPAIGYLDRMATVKKGMLTPSPEWWKHLRWRGRAFWKAERRAADSEAQAEVAPELVVWRRDAGDSRAWVEIIQRDDGLFYFLEERRFHVDDDGMVGAYEYSAPTSKSGLYRNLNDALKDAMEEIDWLSQPKANR